MSRIMNRISKAFDGKAAKIILVTGGDPDIAATEARILALANSGVDMVIIGVPFSDPVAESTAMQEADKRALEAGCTVDKLFDMTKRLREKIDIPLLYKTYANPICAYDKGRFMAKCSESGIDGLIVPDVPFEERTEFEAECNSQNVCLISVLSPSSCERVAKIVADAKGFLYCVPSIGGGEADIAGLISDVKKISPIPCVTDVAIENADGVITVNA